MSEPDQGGVTRAKEDIIIAQKQRYNDVNLHASATGPPPPLEAVNASATLNALGSPFKGGAGYKIDPDALAIHIHTFKTIHYRSTAQYAALITAAMSATPPSHDIPAEEQVNATQTSLWTAAYENRAIAVYTQGLIDALEKACGTYLQREDDTRQVFNSNPLFRK